MKKFKKISLISIIFIIIFGVGSFLLYNEITIIVISKQFHNENKYKTAKAIFDYTRLNIPFAKFTFGPIYDNILGPIERTSGYCDQQSNFFVQICEASNINARMLMLNCWDSISCHTLAEVKIKNKWILFDLTYGYIFKYHNKLLSKDELYNYKFLLDSIYFSYYKPKFYTTGKVEYLSYKRKIVYNILNFLYPIFSNFRNIYQDIYLFFSTLNQQKNEKLFKIARHYQLYNRFDKAIIYYKKLQKIKNYKYNDRTLYLLSLIYIKQNKIELAKKTLINLVSKYPNSSIKDIAYYLLYLYSKNKDEKNNFLSKSNYFDALLIKDKNFSQFFKR